MSDQKRRMKRLEFQREAQRNIEERRLQKEAEKRADEQFWRDQKEEQIRREETIEAERYAIINRHRFFLNNPIARIHVVGVHPAHFKPVRHRGKEADDIQNS